MNLKNNALGAYRPNIILTVVGLLVMTVSVTTPSGAQTTGVPEPDEPLTLEDFYLARGELLASGVDKEASGPVSQVWRLDAGRFR